MRLLRHFPLPSEEAVAAAGTAEALSDLRETFSLVSFECGDQVVSAEYQDSSLVALVESRKSTESEETFLLVSFEIADKVVSADTICLGAEHRDSSLVALVESWASTESHDRIGGRAAVYRLERDGGDRICDVGVFSVRDSFS